MHDALSVHKLQLAADAAEVAGLVVVHLSDVCPPCVYRWRENVPQPTALHTTVHPVYNPRIGNLVGRLFHGKSALRKIHRIIVGVQIVFEILFLGDVFRDAGEGKRREAPVVQDIETQRVAIPLVQIGHRGTVYIQMGGGSGNVVPLEVGLAQIKRVGVGHPMVDARVADEQRLAGHDRMFRSVAGNHIDRPHRESVFADVGRVVEI